MRLMARMRRILRLITVMASEASMKKRNLSHAFFVAVLFLLGHSLAQAHGFKAGNLKIEHPYAVASLASTGAVYFKSIKNEGNTADEMVGARTTVASSIELHEMRMEGDVMKMRSVSSITLPPGSTTRFMHGQATGYHLMLMGLKKPLKEGDRFPVWLQFKQAGEKEVMVWVQTPKTNAHQHEHKH